MYFDKKCWSYTIAVGLVGLIGWLGLSGLGPPALAAASLPQQIILISVGGLNYEAYVSLNLPVLEALMAQGSGGEQALTVMGASQVAAESSLLCSALAEEHQHLKKEDRIAVASLFDLLQEQGRSFLILDGTGGELSAYSYGEDTYQAFANDIDASLLLPAAMEKIRAQRPQLTYICIDDGIDDLSQWDQEAYYAALMDFDGALGGLMDNLKREGMRDHTMLIVCSPASSSPSHYSPLLIYYPPWQGLKQLTGISVLDVLPTIGVVWDLALPTTVRGIPLYGAMDMRGQSISAQYQAWLQALQRERTAAYKRQWQLTEQLSQSRQTVAEYELKQRHQTEFLQDRDEVISTLQQDQGLQRWLLGLLGLVLLLAFYLQYRWLKRKYLLFR